MAMPKKKASKKGAGGKLARSKTVTIRLDPKLHYLTEISARSQRRTTSSFIEWAVERSFSLVAMRPANSNRKDSDFMSDLAERLWHPDEAIRFAKLAIFAPEQMLPREGLLWQIFLDESSIEDALQPKVEGQFGRDWDLDKLETHIYPKIKERWNEFNEMADYEAKQLGYI
jgi:hypothetical protein